MSIHDDSSTVLSGRGSETSAQVPDIQAEKPADPDLPDFYGKSPYVDPEIIALDVGLTKTRYRIHRSILAQSPELAAKPCLKLWGEKTRTMALPELDAVTAHTLVTFLYTGRYEALEWLGGKEKEGVAAYKLAACVYCAAVRYRLPVLAGLAQEKIAEGGGELSIEHVLGVARDHAFPILPEEETWFAGYLEDAIKQAAGADPGLFTKPGFVDQIEGDRRFRQVVMRAIVGTYSGGARGGIGGGDDPPMDTKERVSERYGADSVEYPQPVEPAAEDSHKQQHIAATVDGDQEDIVQLDDIEPTIPESPIHRSLSPAAPESVTDELDFQNSKTYQSMGHTTGAILNPFNADIKPTHVRHDSVVQAEDPAPADKPTSSPTPEVASPSSEVITGATALSKKAKKKKKKKMSKKKEMEEKEDKKRLESSAQLA